MAKLVLKQSVKAHGPLVFCFFVLPPHFRWPFVMKKTTNWAEILQNHAYRHASGRGKKWFWCGQFELFEVKLLKKNIL